MSMNRTVAKVRITRELQEAEARLEEALLSQSSLFSTLITARRDTGGNPFLGQDILLRLVRSQQSLLGAGNDLARVHCKLLDLDNGGSAQGSDGETVQRIEPCPPPAGLQIDRVRSNAA